VWALFGDNYNSDRTVQANYKSSRLWELVPGKTPDPGLREIAMSVLHVRSSCNSFGVSPQWSRRQKMNNVRCSHLLTLAPRSRIFLPWRRRRYVPPKRRFTQDVHSATSQRTAFFTVFTVDQYGWKFGIIEQRLVKSFVISFILFLKWGNWAKKLLLILHATFSSLVS
jgi:hypothetical protein